MPRPRRCRQVASFPNFAVFKPARVPKRLLAEVILTVDEFEALRLADYECLYQQQAAERMAVSRQTFGRIVESARRKVAKALVEGHAIRIEGGDVEMAGKRTFECGQCGHVWEAPFGAERPAACPACGSDNIRRQAEPAAEEIAGEGSEAAEPGAGPAPAPGPGSGRGAGGGRGQRRRRGRHGRRGGD